MKRIADENAIKDQEPVDKRARTTTTTIDLSGADDDHIDDDAALDREIEEIINGSATQAPQAQPPQAPELSPSQQRALDMVKQGRSVFITGNAGSGKSFLIARIIKEMAALRKRAVVTASTGIAAWNTGGTTIHSWSGLGWADKPLKFYTDSLKPDKRKDWEEVYVLIIDEV